MRRRLPPLHALAVFEAAARHNSFSKAAEELCVTHSAVSHQIKQLEEHLGVRMFVRLARAVALTNEGRRFLIEVQAALESLEAASLSISRNERARTLRVNVLQPFAGNWLVERLEAFLQDHPEIDLELEATQREDARALDEVDISVRYGKGEWKGIDFVKLLNVDLFPVCSPAYLKKLGGVKRPEDLSRAVLLRHSMEPWETWFRAIGLPSVPTTMGPLFSDARIMLDAAASGHGVALARSVLAEKDIQAERLVRLFDVTVPAPGAYYALFMPGSRARPEVEAFISWLVSICRKTSPLD